MPVEQLPASHIYPHLHGRPIDAAKVAALADSIRECGLLSPIVVRKAMKFRNGVKAAAWEILAGQHRYEACARVLRWETLPCIVLDVDHLHAEMITIDENLCRAELSPSDRAWQTKRRKQIYEELHPETAHGTAGAEGKKAAVAKLATANASQVDRFTAETAKATGKSERSVQRDAERGERVIDEALGMIRGTALDTGSYLDRIKKLSPNDQVQAVRRDLSLERKKAREAATPDAPAPVRPDPQHDAARRIAHRLVGQFHTGDLQWLVITFREAGAEKVATALVEAAQEAATKAAERENRKPAKPPPLGPTADQIAGRLKAKALSAHAMLSSVADDERHAQTKALLADMEERHPELKGATGTRRRRPKPRVR